MTSTWGRALSISLFGESHGQAVGLVMNGIPPGEELAVEEIAAFMARRAPGRAPWASRRREPDRPKILSGVYRGKTSGAPLTVLVENTDHKPEDYGSETGLLRPSHADYTGAVRYKGANDPRGGGHFSGRLTAPLCFAGGVCLQLLARRNITIAARILELGTVTDAPIDTARPDLSKLKSLASHALPVFSTDKGQEMCAAIQRAAAAKDSVGGIVQCFCLGLPPGLGSPHFGSVEALLASLLYGVPAVKALSFGSGFAGCRRFGSENNDAFRLDAESAITTVTNHAGGVNGGITNGMPLVFQVGIKPTPTIGKPQRTVNIKTMSEETLSSGGRHDPAIVPRAVPVIEAAAAIALMELMLTAYGRTGRCNDGI